MRESTAPQLKTMRPHADFLTPHALQPLLHSPVRHARHPAGLALHLLLILFLLLLSLAAPSMASTTSGANCTLMYVGSPGTELEFAL